MRPSPASGAALAGPRQGLDAHSHRHWPRLQLAVRRRGSRRLHHPAVRHQPKGIDGALSQGRARCPRRCATGPKPGPRVGLTSLRPACDSPKISATPQPTCKRATWSSYITSGMSRRQTRTARPTRRATPTRRRRRPSSSTRSSRDSSRRAARRSLCLATGRSWTATRRGTRARSRARRRARRADGAQTQDPPSLAFGNLMITTLTPARARPASWCRCPWARLLARASLGRLRGARQAQGEAQQGLPGPRKAAAQDGQVLRPVCCWPRRLPCASPYAAHPQQPKAANTLTPDLDQVRTVRRREDQPDLDQHSGHK